MEHKSPAEDANITQDWSGYLSAGDTIASSSWALQDGISNDFESLTNTTTRIVISGGVAGTVYRVTNMITTANGFDSSRDWFLNVQEQIL